MATKQLTGVLRHVRKLIGLPASEELTDGELLHRFVAQYDESAFEVLVQRHGPLVQRVCRRVLADAHDAEDAFQATFLVLARKAASIRQRTSVAGWLYEVAYNLAVRARGNAAKRRLHERRAGVMPKATVERSEREARELLDKELQRLPEKYRTPLVLCYLEGKTNEEAARELGWAPGSMSSRLARARELLRDRLVGKGVALTPAGMALLLSENAVTASVPGALVRTTVQAAARFAAGKGLVAGAVSAEAVALAEGALHTMVTTKLKIAAAVLMLGLLGTSARILIQADAVAQAPAAPVKTPADDKAVKGDVYGDPLPPGAVSRLGTLRWRHPQPVMHVAYTADAKQVITITQTGSIRVWDAANGKLIHSFGQQAAANDGGPIPLQAQPRANRAMSAMPLQQAGVSAVAIAADASSTVAIASHDGKITLWDPATAKQIRSFGWNGEPAVDEPKKNPPEDPKRKELMAMKLRGGVQNLVFSADGKQLLARCPDQFLRVYDPATGKQVSKFGAQLPFDGKGVYVGLQFGPNSLAFSADGKLVIAAAFEQQRANNMFTNNAIVKVFDAATGKEQESRKTMPGQANQGIGQCTLGNDGKTAVYVQYDPQNANMTLHVWDVTAGKETGKIALGQNVHPNAFAFTPDGKSLAARIQNDQSIRLFDLAAAKETGKLSAGASEIVSSNLAFNADGKQLVTGAEGNGVRQWDVVKGKELAVAAAPAGHRGAVNALAVSPDGKTVVTRAANNLIHLWDADTGKETGRFDPKVQAFLGTFSADGAVLALAAYDQEGARVRVWDVKAAKEIKEWKIGQNGISSLALSPDGKTVATRDGAQTIKLWNAAKGIELRTVVEAPANNGNDKMPQLAVAFRPGWNGMASTQSLVFSPDGTVLVGMAFDAAKENANPNPGGAKGGFAPFPGNGGVMTLRTWDVATGKQVRKFDAPKNGIVTFAVSGDGRTVASVNGDNTISLWEAASGKERFNFPIVKAAAKPVDGKPVPQPLPPVPGGAGQADAKEVAKDVLVAKAIMVMPQQPVSTLTTLAYSPDSRFLAGAGNDGIVRVYEAATGKERAEFKGHDQAAVHSLAYAANGKRLASGSADTTALVWDVSTLTIDAMANAQLDPAKTEAAWADLASHDAAKAYQALRVLSMAPKSGVPLFQTNLKPVTPPDDKRLAQLIEDLDSNQFAARMKASEQLEQMGELAEDAIKRALANGPNLEMRQRLERLMDKLVTGQPPPAEQLRVLRAQEALEAIGSAEAKTLLEKMAKGAAGAQLTKDAQGALGRLSPR